MAIIAEGIPERITQLLNKKAKEKGVVIIGPATVRRKSVFCMFCFSEKETFYLSN